MSQKVVVFPADSVLAEEVAGLLSGGDEYEFSIPDEAALYTQEAGEVLIRVQDHGPVSVLREVLALLDSLGRSDACRVTAWVADEYRTEDDYV